MLRYSLQIPKLSLHNGMARARVCFHSLWTEQRRCDRICHVSPSSPALPHPRPRPLTWTVAQLPAPKVESRLQKAATRVGRALPYLLPPPAPRTVPFPVAGRLSQAPSSAPLSQNLGEIRAQTECRGGNGFCKTNKSPSCAYVSLRCRKPFHLYKFDYYSIL